MADEKDRGALLGALEAGGTKMVLATGYADGTVVERFETPTTAPEDVVPRMAAWFKERGVDAVGVGAFGPTGVNPRSATFGHVLDTPKPGWRGYDFRGEMMRGTGVAVGYDTDVNVACLGEVTFGSSRGLDVVVYLTVGTGVGAGVMIDGRLLHGMLHPEAGHVLLTRRADDQAPSSCPFHDNCLEGLAAGPAIQKHWGAPAVELADRPEVWDLESDYLAQALAGYVMCYSPQRIILGGGVMKQEQLFPLVREKVAANIAGYLKTDELADMDSYIVPASLGGDQGIMGCLELARRELEA